MANDRQALVAVCASVAFSLVLVSLVAFVANWRLLPQPDPAYEGVATQPRVLHWFYGYHLQRWDAGWYREIAEQGYQGQSVSFFPLYPAAVKLGIATGLNFPVASSLVSLLATLVSAYFLFKIAEIELGDIKLAQQAVRWLLIFPTAFFLFAPYTEALFLALLLLALYSLKREWYLSASLAAGALALSRVGGVLFVIIVGAEIMRRWREPNVRWKIIGVLAAPFVSLGGYMLYLQAKFGDALAFLHQQASWDRNAGLGLSEFVGRWIKYVNEYSLVFSADNLAPIVSRLVDVSFLVFTLVVALLVFIRWRKDYGLWMFAMVALPLASGTMLGMPRFVMPLPFTYLYLARQVRGETLRWILSTLFTVGWALLLALFSIGYWVA